MYNDSPSIWLNKGRQDCFLKEKIKIAGSLFLPNNINYTKKQAAKLNAGLDY